MEKTVVVYQSKYGTTRKYAQWIAERLGAAIFEASQVDARKLDHYDTVIFGGGLYAGGILGVSLITGNFAALKEKKLIVFTVGLADPRNIRQYDPILNRHFTPEMRSAIQFFHMRGGIGYRNLNFLHKSMMAMLKAKVNKTPPAQRDDEMNQLLETYGQAVDFTDESAIEPLIACAEGRPR